MSSRFITVPLLLLVHTRVRGHNLFFNNVLVQLFYFELKSLIQMVQSSPGKNVKVLHRNQNCKLLST